METQIIATNLVRIRRERGFTQDHVAEAAGLSRAAYRSVEKGRSNPRVDSLRAIAAALGVPIRELVTPTPRLERVRFRSLKRLKSRDRILVDVARWLADFVELEEELGERPVDGLAPLLERVAKARSEGMRQVAAVARDHFGLSVREPIHNVCGLLEARGVKVHAVVVASDAFLGLSVAANHGGPAVVVNTWDRLAVEHWIFSAVHELGHLLLHLGAYDVDQEDEERDQEREADAFASHFLMPDGVFWREWNEAAGLSLLDRVLKVKRVFRVSWRTVLFRASERLAPTDRAAVWRQMNVEYKRRHREPLFKLTEPNGVDEDLFRAARLSASEPAGLDAHDFQGDRLALLVRRGVEREAISLSRGAEILGLTVEEMRERTASWVA